MFKHSPPKTEYRARAAPGATLCGMKPAYASLLVCPLCLGKLRLAEAPEGARGKEELWCGYDGLAYPIIHDLPVMLESEARRLSSEEKLRKKRPASG